MTFDPRSQMMANFGYALPEMTVPRLTADKAAKNGDKVFLHYLPDGRRLTYRDMEVQSNRLAHGLLALGLGPKPHVGVMMNNCPEQVLLYLAIAKIGGVAIPVNTAARGRLLVYLLDHSDSVAVIAEDEYVETLLEVVPDLPRLKSLVVLPSDGQAVAPAPGIAVTAYSELEQGAADPVDAPVAFSDLAMLSYTSGTTGPSKGNMQAHATVVQFGMCNAQSHRYRSDDVIYVCLPLNHANAYLNATWGAFIADASVAISRRFSVSRYWQEIRDSGATITNLLGSMVNMLWTQPPSERDRDHRMRAMSMVPVPRFAAEWEERFGVRVVSSYGLTDFASIAVYSVDDPHEKLGSAGRPRPGFEFKIFDENDVELPPGETGELVLRSHTPWAQSLGYYKMPEATMAATRNLWWHTGDYAQVDEEGYLYFGDRKKDALRRRGENISAYEVETLIVEHPAVEEAAVFAVTSEMSEDEVAVALILVQGATLSETELIEHCARNMAHYMVPRYVQVCDDFPRTSSHKVQKDVLRQRAQADRSTLWDREKAGIVVRPRPSTKG